MLKLVTTIYCIAASWLLAYVCRWPHLHSWLGLPVDPLLGPTNTSSLKLNLPLGAPPELIAKTVAPSVVITEGIIHISVKMIEKIHHWEFIDLSKLLLAQDPQQEDSRVIIEGKIIIRELSSRSQRNITTISDILTCFQAFFRFMAVLLSAGPTTKKEAASIAAHQYLIFNFQKILQHTNMKYVKGDLFP